MSGPGKAIDTAFQGVGQRIGTEIWRIENFHPVAVPKSERGKFYSGDSYIVLQTSGKGNTFHYDIHFWLGKDTSQDEAGAAAIKAVELDAALGGRAVQYREVQGYESDKFLSYFKPCIIPLEGGVASGFKKPEEDAYESRLYTCRGKRVVKMKEVPFARSSLNHDDIFILDTLTKIYQFNGANSSIQERAKALEVVQFLKDSYHEGSCDVAVVDDGKLDTESDSGEFWVLFGGFAPLSRKVVSEDAVIPGRTAPKLYSIVDGEVKAAECELSKGSFENNKSYLLDCGDEIHIWVGRVTQIEERKVAIQAAEDFIASQNRSKAARITRNIQGYESNSFKSNFELWPVGSANPGAEEGRGKVAALLKQQGVAMKGTAKSVQANEEVPPLLEKGGKLEVWLINGSAKTPLPKENIGKFYSGDCYIVLYTYHSSDKKEDYFLCCWLGSSSTKTDQEMSFRLANAMVNSLKGRPVQGQIYQGKESPQFIALFEYMVILKGGLSSGYKECIAEKGLQDDTYNSDCVALFCISGTSAHNNKAVQVDAIATSLNSSECFLLQSGSSMFTWHGNQSTIEQQQRASKIADFLKPGITLKHAKEGTESASFWFPLGGKQNHGSTKVDPEVIRDPHLFAFSLNQGNFRVEEIHNFSQDDLLPEDILILDTNAEVFIWVGQCVDPKEKLNAFNVGQKYIDTAVSVEGLSPYTPLYKVTEGNEPVFFTTFFSWDPVKASVLGNSFHKKMTLLFGSGSQAAEGKSNGEGGPTQRASALAALSSAFNSPSKSSSSPQEKSNGSNSGGPTQRASALAALSSAFTSSPETKTTPRRLSGTGQGSQRAAAVAALSTVLTAEKRKQSPESDKKKHTPDRSPSRSPSETSLSGDSKHEVTPTKVDCSDETAAEIRESEDVASISESNEDSDSRQGLEDNDNDGGISPKVFSYDQLKVHSDNPATGIDLKRREAYLSPDEFRTIFGTAKDSFYKLPKWKQDMMKRKFDLF